MTTLHPRSPGVFAYSPKSIAAMRSRLPIIAAVFLACLAYSLFRAPIPAVNEPHYLCKARHYWQPEWCAGDVFLESSNAHLFFYQTFGAATWVMPLAAAALLGRVLSLALFAVGWTLLVERLLPGRWTPLGAVCVYLALAATGSFSGEWIVGGVESKVFAYALVLIALAAALGGRLYVAGVAAGLAVSFHPVVGAWACVAGAIAWVIPARRWPSGFRSPDAEPGPPLSKFIGPLFVLAICALPGLVPVLTLVQGGSSAADGIQVFVRLAHHLDPSTFRIPAWIHAGVLFCLWRTARRFAAARPAETFFSRFVVGSFVIAAFGIVVGLTLRSPELMKYYPFRLADAFLPIAAAVSLTGAIVRHLWPGRISKLLFAGSMAAALWLPAVDRNSSRMSPREEAAWRDVCEEIRTRYPENALFMTPRETWAFKWYAERPEFHSYKDCPQDAAGILEWNHRRGVEFLLRERLLSSRPSSAALAEIADATGARYCVANTGEMRLPGTDPAAPLFENSHYAIYELPAR